MQLCNFHNIQQQTMSFCVLCGNFIDPSWAQFGSTYGECLRCATRQSARQWLAQHQIRQQQHSSHRDCYQQPQPTPTMHQTYPYQQQPLWGYPQSFTPPPAQYQALYETQANQQEVDAMQDEGEVQGEEEEEVVFELSPEAKALLSNSHKKRKLKEKQAKRKEEALNEKLHSEQINKPPYQGTRAPVIGMLEQTLDARMAAAQFAHSPVMWPVVPLNTAKAGH